jgi:glyoxalase family protein
MLTQIKGLHHVTSMAADAQQNNDFFTKTLGLRRIKKTVNFDAPDVYHLYYGDEIGTPGTVMTYFPFPHIAKGNRGAGEVSETVFAVPEGSLGYWKERLGRIGFTGLQETALFGEKRLRFMGPDGDSLAPSARG